MTVAFRTLVATALALATLSCSKDKPPAPPVGAGVRACSGRGRQAALPEGGPGEAKPRPRHARGDPGRPSRVLRRYARRDAGHRPARPRGGDPDPSDRGRPLTLPSHVSILTALYPPAHGVRDDTGFKLLDAATTLTEHLKAQGYATAASIGARVLAGTPA